MAERLMWKAGGMRAVGVKEPGAGLPPTADAVVVGAGIIGVNVAYHLADRGIKVVVLERNTIASGTTWHAAGQVPQMRGGPRLYPLSIYSGDFYEGLNHEYSGVRPDFRRCGSLNLAQTADRMVELRRSLAHAELLGIEATEVTAGDAAELAPGLRSDDLVGGVWIPGDGRVNPGDAALAIAHAASGRGASFFENARVAGVRTEKGRVCGVDTVRGHIATRLLIDCAGLWSADVIRGVREGLALRAVSHWYFVSAPIPDLVDRTLPVVRDPDAQIYVRDYNGALLVGAFEVGRIPTELSVHDAGYIEFDEKPVTLFDRLRDATNRFPAIADVGVNRVLNAPESFTADGFPMVGPVPGVEGLLVAAGLNSEGILFGPGIGKTVAELVVDGKAEVDTYDIDVARFDRLHDNERYLMARATESLGLLFEMKYPHRDQASGRDLRLSPLHSLHVAGGARFAEIAGWEVPVCFGANDFANDPPTHGLPRWYQCVAAELRAARNAVGIADTSASERIQLIGNDIDGLLSRLISPPMSIGRSVVTTVSLPSEKGGVKLSVDVLATSAGQTYISGPPGCGHRLLAALCEAGANPQTDFVDATESFAGLTVIGSSADKILETLAVAGDLDSVAQNTVSTVYLGFTQVFAWRTAVGHVAGWKLLIPSSQASPLHRELLRLAMVEGGSPLGSAALDALRISAGAPAWGLEFTPETAFEDSGTEWLCVRIQSPNITVMRSDVLVRDGAPIGVLTSVAYDPDGYSDFVALARVARFAQTSSAEKWTVRSGGHQLTAEVTRRSPRPVN